MELARVGLTIEQAAILDLLHEVGGSTSAGEIERITMRQHHSISILINRMIRFGLLGKEKVPGKKRQTIFVTDSGKDALGKLPMGSIHSVFGPLTATERRSLAVSLSALHEKSRQLLGMPYAPLFAQQAASNAPGTAGQNVEECPSDYRLWSLLNRTKFAVGRLRELELFHFGVTLEQGSILEIMHGTGGSTSSKSLRSATLRQHHSISTLVNRMTAMGLLKKRVPRTREGYAIAITSKGRSLAERITRAAIDMTFSALGPAEKRDLSSILHTLNEQARRMLLASSD
jgi:DNA-binding MarR family transcriptional regulator